MIHCLLKASELFYQPYQPSLLDSGLFKNSYWKKWLFCQKFSKEETPSREEKRDSPLEFSHRLFPLALSHFNAPPPGFFFPHVRDLNTPSFVKWVSILVLCCCLWEAKVMWKLFLWSRRESRCSLRVVLCRGHSLIFIQQTFMEPPPHSGLSSASLRVHIVTVLKVSSRAWDVWSSVTATLLLRICNVLPLTKP